MNRARWLRIDQSDDYVGRTGKMSGGGPQHSAVLLAVVCLLATVGPVYGITYSEIHKLVGMDAAAYEYSGYSVSVSGNTAIIGVPNDSDDGTSSGSAYVFDVTTGNELYKLTASDAAAGDGFGHACPGQTHEILHDQNVEVVVLLFPGQ